MIRFILKTIGNNPEFMTIDVKDNDFRNLNDVLQGSRFEIIGIEHFADRIKGIIELIADCARFPGPMFTTSQRNNASPERGFFFA